ncbi:hypothetical protein ACF07T_33730 [Streptomyces sp. NPDC015184]|uniref:hypothetical protein n=1 Tax=Streptomyces sp. NPDC015184 TaxID=3364946 RepID=UPI003702EEFC
MTQNKDNSGTPVPSTPAPSTPVPPPAGSSPATRERGLDLAALVVLIVLACTVFTVAGPEAFSAVTCVGVGLFSTWRARR